MAGGVLPHVAILCFTVLVVWTAQPSSSKQNLFLHGVPFSTRGVGLFSWHPTLMSIAVSLSVVAGLLCNPDTILLCSLCS